MPNVLVKFHASYPFGKQDIKEWEECEIATVIRVHNDTEEITAELKLAPLLKIEDFAAAVKMLTSDKASVERL